MVIKMPKSLSNLRGQAIYAGILLTLTVTMSSSCLRSKKVTIPGQSDLGSPLGQAQQTIAQFVVQPYPSSQPVDGSQLKVLELNLSSANYGSHRSLKFTVKASAGTEFLEYSVCARDNLNDCRPDQSTPGVFSNEIHEFHDPMPGDLTVSVRACVRETNASNPSTPCGEWLDRPYIQRVNSNEELALKLTEVAKQDDLLREECKLFYKKLEYFFLQIQIDPTNQQNTQNLINMMYNTLKLGEYSFYEMVKGGILDLAEQNYELEQLYMQNQIKQQNQALALTDGSGRSGSGQSAADPQEKTIEEFYAEADSADEEEKKSQMGNAAVLLGMGSLTILGGGYLTFQAMQDLGKANAMINGLRSQYEANMKILGDDPNTRKLVSGLENLEKSFSRATEAFSDYSKLIKAIETSGPRDRLQGMLEAELKKASPPLSQSEISGLLEKYKAEISDLSSGIRQTSSSLESLSTASDHRVRKAMEDAYANYKSDGSFKAELDQIKSKWDEVRLASGEFRTQSSIVDSRKTLTTEFQKLDTTVQKFDPTSPGGRGPVGDLDTDLKGLHNDFYGKNGTGTDGLFNKASAKVTDEINVSRAPGQKVTPDMLSQIGSKNTKEAKYWEVQAGKKSGVERGLMVMVAGVIFSVLGTQLLVNEGKEKNKKLSLTQEAINVHNQFLTEISQSKSNLSQIGERSKSLQKELEYEIQRESDTQ